MLSSNKQKNVSSLIELLNQNETKAQYNILKNYDKDTLLELTIEVYKLLKNAEAENSKLKTQISELQQQQSKSNNNSEKKLKELEQKCHDANNRYLTLLKQQEDSFKKNQEMEEQRKALEKITNDYKENQNDDGKYTQNLQNYKDFVVKFRETKMILNELIQKETIYRETIKMTDNVINNLLDNNLRVQYMNVMIMNQFETTLNQMYMDITALEEQNKILKQENNKLNEQIKNTNKTNQQQIDSQQPIIQSKKQSQTLNKNEKNQLFINFNEFKKILIFSNDEFYKILLQSTEDLYLKLQNQNQLVDIVHKLQQQLQLQIPNNFEKLCESLERIRQFFSEIKQYMDNKDNFIDVFHIQDKFFQNYEQQIKQFLELIDISNMIDIKKQI